MQKRHENLRNLAIKNAQNRISTHGLHGLNSRFIAKKIACSVGTLYNLFKSIDFLIFAVNLKTLSTLETLLQQAADTSEKGELALQAMANTYINFARSNPHLWLTLFEHQFTNTEDTPQDYYEQRTSLFHILESQLQHIHPELPLQHIAIEARALWAGIHGICMLNITNKLNDDGYTLQDIAATLVAKFTTQHQGGAV
ncbi:MAG: TetR/AcrR family transcriptional regulator [Ghiorsea sp.]|nr:TetR/AcrR family transcriptional regulator [Ghiorsea sp.]